MIIAICILSALLIVVTATFGFLLYLLTAMFP